MDDGALSLYVLQENISSARFAAISCTNIHNNRIQLQICTSHTING